MIHIAIVSWNRPDKLKRCIDSILPVISDEVQLWVLEQGIAACEHEDNPNIHWFIESENRGCAGGRKWLVLKITDTLAYPDDVLVFLDDDLYATIDSWLDRLIAPIVNDTADISGVEGMDILGDGSTVPAYDPLYPDYVSGGWCAISAKVFLAGVMFDERFFPNYHEDCDLAVQARAKGFRITSVGDIGLVHPPHPVNDDQVLASRAKFIEKHGIGVKS